MGSSSGQQPVTQAQTSTPWSGVQPQLQDLYTRAGDLAGQVQGYDPYPANLQADVTGSLADAFQSENNLARSQLGGTAGVNAARSFGTGLIQSGGFSPELRSLYDQAQSTQNPYLQDILNTSNRTIGDRVNASMSGAGRYGSGAHTDVMTRALAESADPILAQDYTTRRQMAQQIATGAQQTAGNWAQLMPTLDEAQYQPMQHLEDVGQFYQGRANQDVANQVALWNAQQSKQWENLQRYAGILSGAGALGGTKVTTTTPAAPSLLQSIGGGAATGAGLGSIFGAPGAGVGALGGGLLGLLGR